MSAIMQIWKEGGVGLDMEEHVGLRRERRVGNGNNQTRMIYRLNKDIGVKCSDLFS